MAQNTTITIPAGTWTQLTDADVTAISFQARGNDTWVQVTAGATAPTSGDMSGAVLYHPGNGEAGVALSDLAPGVAGGNRVYAWSDTGASAWVSHA